MSDTLNIRYGKHTTPLIKSCFMSVEEVSENLAIGREIARMEFEISRLRNGIDAALREVGSIRCEQDVQYAKNAIYVLQELIKK